LSEDLGEHRKVVAKRLARGRRRHHHHVASGLRRFPSLELVRVEPRDAPLAQRARQRQRQVARQLAVAPGPRRQLDRAGDAIAVAFAQSTEQRGQRLAGRFRMRARRAVVPLLALEPLVVHQPLPVSRSGYRRRLSQILRWGRTGGRGDLPPTDRLAEVGISTHAARDVLLGFAIPAGIAEVADREVVDAP
jgi:hypothetical protein